MVEGFFHVHPSFPVGALASDAPSSMIAMLCSAALGTAARYGKGSSQRRRRRSPRAPFSGEDPGVAHLCQREQTMHEIIRCGRNPIVGLQEVAPLKLT